MLSINEIDAEIERIRELHDTIENFDNEEFHVMRGLTEVRNNYALYVGISKGLGLHE